MLGTLEPADVERLLHAEVVGRIGCISNGRPYVVPVCYAYADGSVYGHTMAGMKRSAMRENPLVCFEVEHVDNLSTWESVIAWGTVKELHGSEAEAGMQILVDRIMPLLHMDATHHPHGDIGSSPQAAVYRIELTEKSGRFERP